MADPTPAHNLSGDARERPDRGSASSATPGPPRWVKVFGIVTLALVVLVVIIIFAGIGGAHGPGRHLQSSDTPPSSIYTAAVQPGVG